MDLISGSFDDENSIDKDLLPDINPIRVEIQGLLEAELLGTLTPQERVDHFLKKLTKNPNIGNAELVWKAITQDSNPGQLASYGSQKLKGIIQVIPQAIILQLWEQILDEFLSETIPELLSCAIQNFNRFENSLELFHDLSQRLESQPMDFVQSVQDLFLSQLKHRVKTTKRRNEFKGDPELFARASTVYNARKMGRG